MGHSEESSESAGEFLGSAALKSAPRLGRFFFALPELFNSQKPSRLTPQAAIFRRFAAGTGGSFPLQRLLSRPFGRRNTYS